MKHFMKRTVYTAGISAAVAAAALGLGGCAAGTQMPDTLKVQNVDAAENVITVTGREEVKVVPDMARIEYAVYTREDTAAACQEKNARPAPRFTSPRLPGCWQRASSSVTWSCRDNAMTPLPCWNG